jgi:hypothetical protein
MYYTAWYRLSAVFRLTGKVLAAIGKIEALAYYAEKALRSNITTRAILSQGCPGLACRSRRWNTTEFSILVDAKMYMPPAIHRRCWLIRITREEMSHDYRPWRWPTIHEGSFRHLTHNVQSPIEGLPAGLHVSYDVRHNQILYSSWY